MSRYIPFILFTVLTNAAAQMLLKYGMMQLGPLSFSGVNPVVKILSIVFSPFVFLGLCVFVVSMASHLFVLSKVDLSYAYPFLSLAYVVVAFAAWALFGEQINASAIAGIALICLGTVFIARGGSQAPAAAEVEARADIHSTEGTLR
ncbi:EamA family transporter [Aureimonas sp. ME7]|uniref:EamA family transporter n=1 Tax=Aureimonas sp. ME7 TaxID=2744252 RepID=UPI0015F48E40|nr:EamA family transporter [Aureimonas sp. ME7]